MPGGQGTWTHQPSILSPGWGGLPGRSYRLLCAFAASAGSHAHPKATRLLFLALRLKEKKTLCARAGSTHALPHFVSDRPGREQFTFFHGWMDCSQDLGENPQITTTNRPDKQNCVHIQSTVPGTAGVQTQNLPFTRQAL